MARPAPARLLPSPLPTNPASAPRLRVPAAPLFHGNLGSNRPSARPVSLHPRAALSLRETRGAFDLRAASERLHLSRGAIVAIAAVALLIGTMHFMLLLALAAGATAAYFYLFHPQGHGAERAQAHAATFVVPCDAPTDESDEPTTVVVHIQRRGSDRPRAASRSSLSHRVCLDCGEPRPTASSSRQSFAGALGWKSVRFIGPRGERVSGSCCPSCWRTYKRTSDPDVIPASAY